MLSRKTLAPSCTNCRSVSGFSLAGPSVQMILVLRIGTVNRPAKPSCCNVRLTPLTSLPKIVGTGRNGSADLALSYSNALPANHLLRRSFCFYRGRFGKVLPAYAKYFFYKTMAAPPSKGLGLFNYGVNINPNDNGGNGVTIWKDASWHFVDDCYIGFKKTVNGIVLNRPRPALGPAPLA